jgi:hypothetical protein
MRALVFAGFGLVLAAMCPAQRLFVIDAMTRGVFAVDPATAVKAQVGTMSANIGLPAALAYDPAAGRMWVSSAQDSSLYIVDVTNWQAMLVGPFGVPSFAMHGLEWDSSTNKLFGACRHDGGLYTIDTGTGTATLVGLTGLPPGNCYLNLAHDPVTDTMWMTHAGTDRLYSVDRVTGQATMIGLLSAGWTGAAAFHPENGRLWITNSLAATLCVVSTTTGMASPVGSLGAGTNMLGLVYVPGAGRLTREAHACGPTTIHITGLPALGAVIATQLGGVIGIPLIGYGITAAGLPYCGCTIGHEWAATVIGSASSFTLPMHPSFLGAQLLIQGADIAGIGGCVNPPLTLTDTITVTIG